ncbi:unnamed protein product, partial [Staurois parvus]
MTADLWGGRGSGYLNLTGTRSHFRGVVLPLVWAPGCAREALHFVIGPPSSGTCHVYQKTL